MNSTPRVFAIGDIHGCNKTFRKLLFEEIEIQKTDHIFCVGDYIDRGPDSQGVIDTILDLRDSGFQIHTLRGNHEQIMMDSILSERDLEVWLDNGADATLKSFGISSYAQIDPKYSDFFDATDYHLEYERFIFVHAGLDFEGEDPFQNTHAMMWIRNFPIDSDWLGDRVIVHGHTPIPVSEIFEQKGTGAINIDGGCVHQNRPGMGHLIALNVQNMRFLSIECMDV